MNSSHSLNTPTSALIVVDIQKGIMQMVPPQEGKNLIDANNRLVDAFRQAKQPIIWVHATGLPPGKVERPIPEPENLPAWFADLSEELHDHEGDAHIYKKRTWSAFPGTELHSYLQKHGITDLILTGIATGAGVDSTARSAYDEGYNVFVVADATLDGSEERHQSTLSHDVPSYGTVLDVASVVNQLSELQRS